jgi:hypothetical protein
VNRRAGLIGIVLLLLGLAATTGCQSPAPPSPAPSLVPAARWQPATHLTVGRIARVEEDGRNVLIQLSPYAATPAPAAGDTLRVRDEDLTLSARLRVGPHRAGDLIEAVILEGRPRPADEVVAPRPQNG